MNHAKKIGAEGETMAVAYLQQHGYRILERNWRTRYGEIDIIAVKETTLYFFEVKRRGSERFGHPYAAVTNFKLYKIRQAIQMYLASHPQVVHKLSIGVIGILGNTIECIENIYDN